MFIYVITNSATGKVYIGQHKGNNLKKYLQTKLSDASKHRGGQSRLYNSMRKHPKEVWSIEPLMEAETKAELDRLEILLIALYDTRNPNVGYNICRGGEGYTGPLTDAMKAAWHKGNKRYWDSQELVPGQTFNRLTVVSKAGMRKGKKLWNCLCSCGNKSVVTTHALKSGGIKSCGCLHVETQRERWSTSTLIGQTFGQLTVESESVHYKTQKQWNCLCSCGNHTVVRTGHLKSGAISSCGTAHNNAIKREAVRLRVEEGKRLLEITRQLGIPAPTCCQWLKPYPLPC
jgi:hypothetical protein